MGASQQALIFGKDALGLVRSVGLALPTSIFTITGSPVINTGTLTGSFKVQNKNKFFAGPVSGADAVPTMRLMDVQDLPAIASGYVYANITASAAVPTAITVSALLDYVFGNVKGEILVRSATGWVVKAVGADGTVLLADSSDTTGVTWAVAGAVTWDRVTFGASAVFSNAGLTATTTTAAYETVRAALSKTTGKWYAEIVIGPSTTNNNTAGFCKSTFGLSAARVGTTADSWGLLPTGFSIYNNVSSGGAVTAAYGNGDVIMLAMDLDNGFIWFGKNGTWSGNPAAGTGAAYSGVTGPLYFAVSLYVGSAIGHFSAASLAYSSPSGFSSLDVVTTPVQTTYPEIGATWVVSAGALSIPLNEVPHYIKRARTLVGVSVLTQGGTGSCVLDVWKIAYASYPPAVANSICGASKPQIIAGVKFIDFTLSGWTTTFAAGDTVILHVQSTSGFNLIALKLHFSEP